MRRKIIGGIIIGCFVLLVAGIPLLSKMIYPDNISNKCSNSEEVQAYKMAQKKRAFKNEMKKLSREINFPHNLYMKTHPKLQDEAVADLLCKEVPGTDINIQGRHFSDGTAVFKVVEIFGHKLCRSFRR